MKTIGLLGGTSWPSTPLYYEKINWLANQSLGGYHSASIILYSIDYHPIKTLYTEPNSFSTIAGLLLKELQRLRSMKPDSIIVCNNTLHKALDILEGLGELKDFPPIFHAVDSVGEALLKQKYKKVLLLGTKFTMEDGFYGDRLSAKYGLEVGSPTENDRDKIQEIQTAVSLGRVRKSFNTEMAAIIKKYDAEYDAVLLACTELPMVVSSEELALPVFNPIDEQCKKAVCFSLAGDK